MTGPAAHQGTQLLPQRSVSSRRAPLNGLLQTLARAALASPPLAAARMAITAAPGHDDMDQGKRVLQASADTTQHQVIAPTDSSKRYCKKTSWNSAPPSPPPGDHRPTLHDCGSTKGPIGTPRVHKKTVRLSGKAQRSLVQFLRCKAKVERKFQQSVLKRFPYLWASCPGFTVYMHWVRGSHNPADPISRLCDNFNGDLGLAREVATRRVGELPHYPQTNGPHVHPH